MNLKLLCDKKISIFKYSNECYQYKSDYYIEQLQSFFKDNYDLFYFCIKTDDIGDNFLFNILCYKIFPNGDTAVMTYNLSDFLYFTHDKK